MSSKRGATRFHSIGYCSFIQFRIKLRPSKIVLFVANCKHILLSSYRFVQNRSVTYTSCSMLVAVKYLGKAEKLKIPLSLSLLLSIGMVFVCHVKGRVRQNQSVRVSTTEMSSSRYNRVKVEDLLNQEERSDSNENPREIICHLEECGRQFVSHEALIAHQKRSHAAPTSYICRYCQMSYSTVPNLNKHVSTTLPSVLILSLMPLILINLHFVFSFVYLLYSLPPLCCSQIRSVHLKVKPYKCDKCSSTFAFKDGLQRHNQMVHDQVRPFPCPHCNLKFKTKAHLSKHSLALHPEKHGTSNEFRP